MQLKYSNYVAFSHIRGKVVNNSGLFIKIPFRSRNHPKGYFPLKRYTGEVVVVSTLRGKHVASTTPYGFRVHNTLDVEISKNYN